MWGPNAQGVRSRPDRSVSLLSPELQRMGFDFDEFDRLLSEGTSEEEWNPWDLVVDPETGELVERGAGHLEPDHEETGGVPGRRLTEEEYEQHRRRQVRRMLERLDEENITEEDFRRWTRGEAPLFSPDEDRSQGLSGEERALMGQTGGFAPSPPMSGSLPNRPTNLPAGSPGFDARSPELLRALQASSQRVNPQQEVFPGMGGWQEQLAEARQKLKEAERREAERAAARHVSRPTPKGPPIPRNQNPESGAASQFAPSGQLPVDPTAFRAPQGQTMDWFNNLSTEQKVGMALMLMSGGMAAGGGAAAAGGGAALRGGAALLPLILNQ